MSVFPSFLPELNEKITHNYKGMRYSLEYAKDVGNSSIHRHNFLEFTYVTKGSGTETINGIEHLMKPGTFTVLLPYHVHKINSDPENPLSFYLGSISLETFFGPSKNNLGLNDLLFDSDEKLPPYVHIENSSLTKMNNLFEDIYAEFISELQWNDLNVISKITEAMIIFDRCRRKTIKIENLFPRKFQKNDFWEIVYYIHTNYMNELTLKSLEDQFHINSFYISKLFKKHLNINFVDFLHDIRIRHACSLLTSTEMAITDIAVEVGYNSYVTFSRAFLHRKGFSAGVFRSLKANNAL